LVENQKVTPRKLNLLFATFPYGGNGASASEHPDIRNWLLANVPKATGDDRVGQVIVGDFNDTPITMTRNRAVLEARQQGFDVLVMVDSDQRPDKYLPGLYPDEPGDPAARPFWDDAFNFLYDHWEKGPVCIGAPYCGCPPCENVFVFEWRNLQSEHPNVDMNLSQYSREEAHQMAGIQPCAALPTGVIMFDMRLFQLTDPVPSDFHQRVANRLRIHEGQRLDETAIEELSHWIAQEKLSAEQSWFYYEWENEFQANKASTEDVTATRDLSLIGIEKLGYNPVHCAWSSWAGHWKPKCVGKPAPMPAEMVSSKMKRALTNGVSLDYRQVEVNVDRSRWGAARTAGPGDHVEIGPLVDLTKEANAPQPESDTQGSECG
jgi:hypothetical protein